MSPLTVLASTVGSRLACRVTLPDTVLTLVGPSRSSPSTGPLTVLRSMAPTRSLRVTVPDTVLTETLACTPVTTAVALTVLTLGARGHRHRDADDRAVAAEATRPCA